MFLQANLAKETKFVLDLLKFSQSAIDFMKKYSNFAEKKAHVHGQTGVKGNGRNLAVIMKAQRDCQSEIRQPKIL